MEHGIQDELFDALESKGLLHDIEALAQYRGMSMSAEPQDDGWLLSVITQDQNIQVRRASECVRLSYGDRSKEYSCDAEGVVGAIIDLMKITLRK